MKRVVITGMGTINPLAANLPDFEKAIRQGMSGAGPITRFDASPFKTHFACEVKNYDPLNYFERQEVRKMDLYTQFALIAADEAIQHAALPLDQLNKDRVGVIWASGDGGVGTFEEAHAEYLQAPENPRFNPFFVPKRIINMASGMISIKYGFHGVNFTTVTACAASNTALIEAFNYIKWGKADVVIAGGSEASVVPTSVGGFNASKAMSTRNEDPESASRPFDTDRDGFVLGEGGSALVLESLDHALARGASIIAEIGGGGLAADAYHMTGTHPEGYGAALGMRLAMEEAEITPTEVDYINAHATSTGIGDISELKAIESVFGARANLAISATKSQTGHLLGGAGALEGIITALAVQHNFIPPTINTQNIEPEFDRKWNIVLNRAQEKEVNYALSNTFGFGGHIAVSLFKKYRP